MTLEELESLKQERLRNQPGRLQAAQANAERARICVEGFRASGFDAMRRRAWELYGANVRDREVEEAAEIWVENQKIPLSEAEQLLSQLAAREAK